MQEHDKESKEPTESLLEQIAYRCKQSKLRWD